MTVVGYRYTIEWYTPYDDPPNGAPRIIANMHYDKQKKYSIIFAERSCYDEINNSTVHAIKPDLCNWWYTIVAPDLHRPKYRLL